LDDRADGFHGVPLEARRQGTQRSKVSRSVALLFSPQRHVAGSAGAVWTLEQRVEALLAPEPQRCVRSVFRGTRLAERTSASRPDVRLDRRSRPRVGRRRQRGQQNEALGRSRGGFSTKIHLKTDLDGHPIGFHLTGGEASDSKNFAVLLNIEPDGDPRAIVADKGYDAKANRAIARRRGICPVIPHRSTTVAKPKFFARLLYKARARIEQAVGKIKRFKRIALRCEKTARNYGSLLALVAGFILIKSVHTT
jgi:transposase